MGGPFVRGDAGVDEGGVWESRDVLENERLKREDTLRRRQRAQIMLSSVEGNRVTWMGARWKWRINFLGVVRRPGFA